MSLPMVEGGKGVRIKVFSNPKCSGGLWLVQKSQPCPGAGRALLATGGSIRLIQKHKNTRAEGKQRENSAFLLPLLSHQRDPDNNKHEKHKYRFVITIICCRAKGRLWKSPPPLHSQSRASSSIDFCSRTPIDKCN